MSFAFKGTETFHYSLGVVNDDHGAVATQLVQSLESKASRAVLTVVPLVERSRGPHRGSRRPRGGRAGDPDGLQRVAQRSAPGVTRHRHERQSPDRRQRHALDRRVVHGADQRRPALGRDRTRLGRTDELARRRCPARRRHACGSRSSRSSVPSAPINSAAISYYSPAMAIFFLLFTISFASRSFFVDRAEGMIERMRAAPVRPAEILVGKALSVFVYGIAQPRDGRASSLRSPSARTGAARWPPCLLGLALVVSSCASPRWSSAWRARSARPRDSPPARLRTRAARWQLHRDLVVAAPHADARALHPERRSHARFHRPGDHRRRGLSTVVRPIEAILAHLRR